LFHVNRKYQKILPEGSFFWYGDLMASENFSFDDFLKYKSVSRETYDRLQNYVALLLKWQKSINLVSAATLRDVWKRHIIDSIQLLDYIIGDEAVADIGSGAGLPGLVIAIAGRNGITLIESDRRKVAFLKEASRIIKSDVHIIHNRVEKTDLNPFPLIMARGFAPLIVLLDTVSTGLQNNGKLLLLKGKSYQNEIAAAKESWAFDYTAFPSVTDKDGVILSIQNLKKKRGS
jgi:16S rRNA (guanine527-N7)-methyltransferase